MKRTLILVFLIVGVGLGFEWGVYAGPGISASLTNMNLVSDGLAAYDLPSIPFYQIGITTPFIVRLWKFTIGGGRADAWQVVKGDEYKASLDHHLDIAELGYIVDLNDQIRLRPIIGLGDYEIDLRISELGGGFGDPAGEDAQSWEYDYDNYSLVAGLACDYLWKFANRVVVGFEAKARYLIPLQANVTWRANGWDYNDVEIPGFYPHTPIIGISVIVGYEKTEADRDKEWGEEPEDDNWDDEDWEDNGWDD
ncbi:hypothetical protein JXM67_07380 [candidate division WOR-3 bacterium]|nr:hypothetical protein [candidate division WOR-3 bacterium]